MTAFGTVTSIFSPNRYSVRPMTGGNELVCVVGPLIDSTKLPLNVGQVVVFETANKNTKTRGVITRLVGNITFATGGASTTPPTGSDDSDNNNNNNNNTEEDMPIDNALYESNRNVIYGVRAGFIYKFNSSTGNVITSSRFVAPAFSDSFITYVPDTDHLYVGVWNTHANMNNDYRSKFIYKINPDTLSISASYDLNDPFNQMGHFSSGPRQMVMSGSTLVGIVSQGEQDDFFIVFGFDPVAETFGNSSNYNDIGFQRSDLVYDDVNNLVWGMNDNGASSFDGNFGGVTTINLGGPGGGYTPRGMVHVNTTMYFTLASNGGKTPQYIAYKADDDSGSTQFIDTGVTNSTAFNLRYDTVTDRIYVATYQGDSIVVINPNDNTVESVKTGFSSPWDVVCTPTKRFAVQFGTPSLKEIV